MPDVGSSVGIKDGTPCYNNPDDQKIVMDLLEKIDSSNGGVMGDPKWKRPADATLRWKVCPELLRAAILDFQTKNQAKLPYRPDGHVDPGGVTIRLMNSLAASFSPTTVIGGVTVEGGLDEVELEIHDLRIEGSGRFGAKRHVRYVNSKTPISAVLNLVDIEIRNGKQITRLDLLAHGYHVGGGSDPALFGVMVGREGFHGGFRALKDLKDPDDGSIVFSTGSYAENLSPWKRFRGRIDEIRFYSCGAANRAHKTGTGVADVDLSGYEMCSRLAVESGAYVMAAEQTQNFIYWWDTGDWPWRQGDRSNTRVAPTSFGAWEGTVHVFSPISGREIASSSNGADPVYTPGA
jgi:hypothetical protein